MRSISRAFLFPGSMARALSMAFRALAWLFCRKWFRAALVRASTSDRRPSGVLVRAADPGSEGGPDAGGGVAVAAAGPAWGAGAAAAGAEAAGEAGGAGAGPARRARTSEARSRI